MRLRILFNNFIFGWSYPHSNSLILHFLYFGSSHFCHVCTSSASDTIILSVLRKVKHKLQQLFNHLFWMFQDTFQTVRNLPEQLYPPYKLPLRLLLTSQIYFGWCYTVLRPLYTWQTSFYLPLYPYSLLSDMEKSLYPAMVISIMFPLQNLSSISTHFLSSILSAHDSRKAPFPALISRQNFFPIISKNTYEWQLITLSTSVSHRHSKLTGKSGSIIIKDTLHCLMQLLHFLPDIYRSPP